MAWQDHIGKVGRHGTVLHVAEKVDIDGPVHGFGKRADSSCKVAEAGAAVTWLDAFESRAQPRGVRDRLTQNFKLSAEGDDLRLVPGELRLECSKGLPLGV